MIKVCFVCLGNICRSPMAEFIFKDFVKNKGKEDCFYVFSKGVSDEEEGNPVYPPAKKELQKHGIDCSGKFASQFTVKDYERSDYVLCAEDRHVNRLTVLTGGDKDKKIKRLLDFCGGGNIADPWYTGDFSVTYDDIVKGVQAFWKYLVNDGKV